jgi:predicted Zn-dependent protease
MSKIRKNKLLLLFFYCYLLFSSAIAVDTVDFGTAGVRALSLEKERELGSYFITFARSELPIIYDPVLQQYLEGLVGRLSSKAKGVNYPFEVFIVQDKSINAAAFFGGKIMLHSGLFTISETESELASVVAHEMTHVTQRHLARMMEDMNNASNVGIAGVLGAIILSIINPAAGMAGITATIGGMRQAQLNYTRAHEYEADRLGIDLLYQAGFDPDGMARMMRTLMFQTDKVNPAFEMLLTHPLSQKRVAEAENRARNYHKHRFYESIDFAFAKSRVEVRFSNLSIDYNLKLVKEKLEKNPNDIISLYKKSLLLIDLKKYNEALKVLNKVEKQYPNNLFVIDTKTDILLGLNKYQEAISFLNKKMHSIGENQVISVNLAYSYIKNHEFSSAKRILNRVLREEFSVVANDLLMDIYRQEKNVCALYQLNVNSFEYKGQWELALNNAKEALRKCSEKNTVLKIQAQMGRIVNKREFYDSLLDN